MQEGRDGRRQVRAAGGDGEISATAIGATRPAYANRMHASRRPRHPLSGLLDGGVGGGPLRDTQPTPLLHGDLGTILEWAGNRAGSQATGTPRTGMPVSVITATASSA